MAECLVPVRTSEIFNITSRCSGGLRSGLWLGRCNNTAPEWLPVTFYPKHMQVVVAMRTTARVWILLKASLGSGLSSNGSKVGATHRSCSAPAAQSSGSGRASGWGSRRPAGRRAPPGGNSRVKGHTLTPKKRKTLMKINGQQERETERERALRLIHWFNFILKSFLSILIRCHDKINLLMLNKLTV